MPYGLNEPVDLMLQCPARGVVNPVRMMWHGREIRLEPKPTRVDKTLGGHVWDYWCRNEDGSNVYHLRWDVKKMEWWMVDVNEG